MAAVSLRPYPAPYHAALAICSDLDDCSPEAFMAIHRFLNTTRATPWGPGVGLEIADTFWLYTAAPQPGEALSYFQGTSTQESRWAPMLRDFLRAGYIDTLHAYGDFSQVGGFRRALAEQAARALQDHGLRVAVWTNHGDRHNAQDVHEPWSRGDVAGSAEYHWDVTRQLGVEFIWRSVDLTQLWGQERPLQLGDLMAWERWRHPRTAARWYAAQWHARGRHFWRNPVLEPITLRDSAAAWAFKRYGHFSPHDRADDLGGMLSEARLNALVQRGGTALVYTHLGKRAHPRDPAIPPAALAGLRRLAAWAQRGKIWVTTTARLLRYLRARDSLRFHAETQGDWLHLHATTPQPVEALGGLTFVADRPRPAKVWVGQQEVSIRAHTEESSGRGLISIPWQPLAAEALEAYWDQGAS